MLCVCIAKTNEEWVGVKEAKRATAQTRSTREAYRKEEEQWQRLSFLCRAGDTSNTHRGQAGRSLQEGSCQREVWKWGKEVNAAETEKQSTTARRSKQKQNQTDRPREAKMEKERDRETPVGIAMPFVPTHQRRQPERRKELEGRAEEKETNKNLKSEPYHGFDFLSYHRASCSTCRKLYSTCLRLLAILGYMSHNH